MKWTWSVLGQSVVAILGSLVFLLVLPSPAPAHWADLAVAEILVSETRTRITLTFPTGLVAVADENKDGQLSPDEIRTHRAVLHTILGERIRLSDGEHSGVLTIEPSAPAALPRTPGVPERSPGSPGAPATSDKISSGQRGVGSRVTPRSHTTLLLVYTWTRPVQRLTIHYGFFPPGVPTASCLTTILEGRQVRTFVFTPQQQDFSFTLGGRSTWAQAWSFLVLGIEHILTGYDHILFLVGLLMLGGGMRYLFKVVSGFTVAHSLTLSLAVLNVITLPGRWVESAIALSIVYVAAENFWRKEQALRGRWLVTFGFGLVHGLGFASVLQDLYIPRANLAVSLASFNLGVEVGQVAIVSAAFLALHGLQTRTWAPGFRRWASAATAAIGLSWFIQRALL